MRRTERGEANRTSHARARPTDAAGGVREAAWSMAVARFDAGGLQVADGLVGAGLLGGYGLAGGGQGLLPPAHFVGWRG